MKNLLKKVLKWTGISLLSLIALITIIAIVVPTDEAAMEESQKESGQARNEAIKQEQAENKEQKQKEQEEESAKKKAEEEKAKVEAEKKKAEEEKNAENKEMYDLAIKNVIEQGEGAIISIQPKDEGDYGYLIVTIADDWYYLEDFQQERVAEGIYDKVYTPTKHWKMIGEDDELLLDIKDINGKTVASYSIWSGMKVKK